MVIGPQLDGIGGRGRDRLLEDVLDPNRNVDPAFRMIEVELKTGIPKKGLKRRITDTEIVIADQDFYAFLAGQQTGRSILCTVRGRVSVHRSSCFGIGGAIIA